MIGLDFRKVSDRCCVHVRGAAHAGGAIEYPARLFLAYAISSLSELKLYAGDTTMKLGERAICPMPEKSLVASHVRCDRLPRVPQTRSRNREQDAPPGFCVVTHCEANHAAGAHPIAPPPSRLRPGVSRPDAL